MKNDITDIPLTSIHSRRYKLGKAPHGGRLAAVWEYRKSSTDASKVYKPKHSERSRESLRGWNRQVLAHRRSF